VAVTNWVVVGPKALVVISRERPWEGGRTRHVEA
jgi:hypothetical protein